MSWENKLVRQDGLKGQKHESFELSRQSVMGSASNWLVAWPGAFRMDIVRKVGAKIE